MLKRFKFVSLVVLSLILTLISACNINSNNASKKPYYIHITLAPVNQQQVEIAKKLILNAKEDNGVNGQTQVIQANNTYTVAEICSRNTPDFLAPNIEMSKEAEANAVTSQVEKSLKQIIKGEKRCAATADALPEVFKNLNQAASSEKNYKMIIFYQAPWSREEVTDSKLAELTEAVNHLAQSNRVERLILLGVNPNGSDRLASAFSSLVQRDPKKFKIAYESRELIEQIKAVRRDYLN